VLVIEDRRTTDEILELHDSWPVDRALLEYREEIVVIAGAPIRAHVMKPLREVAAVSGAQGLELAHEHGVLVAGHHHTRRRRE